MKIQENVNLAQYTSFKIGGAAKYFGIAKSRQDLIELLKLAKNKNLPFLMLGRGSNVLISDNGFGGLVILNQARSVKIDSNEIVAESGVSLAELAEKAGKKGFFGLEWATSIPGTLGGAVRGNAGAFGSEIKDFIEEAEVFDCDKDKIFILKNKDCGFNYRHSIFKENPSLIVLAAKIKLGKKTAGGNKDLIKDYITKRNFSQDLRGASAGCIFKNVAWSRKDINQEELIGSHPELKRFVDGQFIPAGFLIDYLGLKGFEIGGAAVSKKHGNFIINKNKAKADDVLMLVSLIKERVHRHYEIQLEEEIQIVL